MLDELQARFRLQRPLALACGLLFCLLIASQARAQNAPLPLTNLNQVLNLPRTALAAKPAVRIRAVVTCVDQDFSLFFIQQGQSGIFIYCRTTTPDPEPGELVEVSGVAASGVFSPYIDATRIEKFGRTNLPPGREVPMGALMSGQYVGERVRITGIAERIDVRGNHLVLSLADGENSCTVRVQSFAGFENLALRDSRLTVTGVLAAYINAGQLTGFQMHANDLSDLEVITRPTDRFSLPLSPIASARQYPTNGGTERRVRVAGVVTLQWSNKLTVIQDTTGGMLVEGKLPDLSVGSQVEVAGYLVPGRLDRRLRNAEARRTGSAPLPAAKSLAFSGADENDHLIVHVQARVLDWQHGSDGLTVAPLEASNSLLIAVLPSDGTDRVRELFPPGSMVNVTGVVSYSRLDSFVAARPSLSLRSAADLGLVQLPSAVRSPRTGLFAIILASLAALGFVFLWLRHRQTVRRSLLREQETSERFDEMQKQLRRSQRYREVLMLELHDNTLQSIFSVGLGLDAARNALRANPPQAENRIVVAIEGLNAILRDLRAFIGGMEPRGIRGPELKAALKSVLLTCGSDEELRCVIEIDSTAARDLTNMQATEVFNIAKEAMSNSIRHSQAGKITVSLTPHRDAVRLEVVDDGVGFDLSETKKPNSLGITNMQRRAGSLGARLDIITAPGQGARILMDIPYDAHDSQ